MGHKIRFFFRTLTLNSILHDFLARFQSESETPLQLTQPHREISLLAVGEEEELAVLAETLGREIPLSIFLTQSGIQPADEKDNDGNSVAQPRPGNPSGPGWTAGFRLPPCPRCLRQAEEHFQAGRTELNIHCAICSRSNPAACQVKLAPSGPLRFEPTPATAAVPDPRAQHTFLAQAAGRLAQGQALTIISPTGTATVSSQPATARNQLQVLITDPRSIPNHWLCGDDELLRLAAWEKPLVILHPSEHAQQSYQLPSAPLPVGLADDLGYWYLSRHLQNLEVPLLFLTEIQAAHQRPLLFTDHGQCWLLSGTRAITPLLAPLNFTPELTGSSSPDGFRVTVRQPKSAVGNHISQGAGSATVVLEENHPAVASEKSFDQPSQPDLHRQAFAGFLATTPTTPAFGRVFGITLTFEPDGMALLAARAEKETAIILSSPAHYQPIKASTIIAQIAGLDPQGMRLWGNFSRHFPERRQAVKALEPPLQITALGDLCALLLLLCGQPADTPMAAQQRFLELAAQTTPGRSPQLELIREEDRFVLDHRLLCRSAMSYALAGATPAAICRGFLESLAERLARCIWEQTPPGSAPQVALCTPLCLHPAFFQAIRRQGNSDFLLPPPPVPLNSLPTIGRLWDQPSSSDHPPLPAARPSSPARRELLKNALDIFK
ncbi:hypothetical protein [Desulfurivibrio dismutans]|uniref:hypothetical protein n=1 Tax=Desulfurivibrio dismutans TaxID=1398908 RepID=UPI0023DA2AA0|nr:hypothetical protein [Desulfurivibrio alkaliphilus]MDF1615560.1 hypothetical protein [Desulfurivibrio alkaliphilus]